MSRPSANRWILVTGQSGAGKTATLKVLEDLGFYIIDNLPANLVPALTEEFRRAKKDFSKLVLGMDLRGHNDAATYGKILKLFRKAGIKPEIIFLESRPEVLVRRFSESRRPHPLGKGGQLLKAIHEEKRRLASIRKLATWVIDSSEMSVHQLKKALRRRFSPKRPEEEMRVALVSFGYKHGLPAEADLVLDLRFLDNPFFVPRLKNLDGRSRSVQKFVWEQKDAKAFQKRFLDLIGFLLPRYREEGKTSLVIAFGCTGGKHRSVAVVESLFPKLKKLYGSVEKSHRDCKRE